ncbi:hypothetical protein SMACR_05196 [Sordaria macrospora]|uniref:WGS project CABT00000000 data, contig 2.8 n=2 Tax=Sordaria macrospora TaxID=5147 RepID=F7VV40_SORMK|nr:uncharacterized protein SMAC_05196 [Sordaria macrospora k-hell]KAA8632410.1 hypothetical protein SMACR_05196 [Sordaria macrospora]KAH7628779.1 hypothetical protein B0T09DRAFT_344644 [Sordaria sp. MPI-SDFR-AT-0083]WPJ57314.1 hypothetical protein SMAC4_05196 [Sordaria macrospora]CCC09387.1 unnamed protein product [Sordaria macrospora k-hell]
MCATQDTSSNLNSRLGSEMVQVLVGKEQRDFQMHKKLLCTTSTFFRDHVEAAQKESNRTDSESEDSVLWLPEESPEVFELFIVWLYDRRAFQAYVDSGIEKASRDRASPTSSPSRLSPARQSPFRVGTTRHAETCGGDRRTLRWNLVRLHLFAEIIDLPALQDASMDALQDMYLRCDWDMSPGFITFLYGDCSLDNAVRLRKWAVAMLAWTLHGGDGTSSQFEKLFAVFPKLKADYGIHFNKMAASKADIRIKNPQLRLPMNNLRSEERFFGFRQCSFHSHRSTVGEGVCPHLVTGLEGTDEGRSTIMGDDIISEEDEEELEGGEGSSDSEIITPVCDMETSFLDLS